MMRTLIFVIIAFSLIPTFLHARQLTPEEALSRINREKTFVTTASTGPYTPRLESTLSDSLGNRCVYIFSDSRNASISIVSADDCARPVLAHDIYIQDSVLGLPPAMTEWIDSYVREISAAVAAGMPCTENAPQSESLADIAPLLSSQWNQGNPYNLECPVYSGNERCNTGCVATAVAQIMYRYKYPAHGTGSHSYTDEIRGRTVTLSADFGSTTYDWASMTPTYGPQSTSASKKAVSRLMSHLGVATEMDYDHLGLNQSGASLVDAAKGLIKYFSYSRQIRYLEQKYFQKSAWVGRVHAELSAGRPLLYEGRTDNSGHAFVCDGYRKSSDCFHFNWGWGGNGDGYYALSALIPDVVSGAGGGNYNYTGNQAALFGIMKPTSDDHYIATVKTYGDLVAEDPMSYSNSRIKLKIINSEYTGFYNNVMADGETSFVYALRLTPQNGGEPIMLTDNSPVTLESGYGSRNVYIPSPSAMSVPGGDYSAQLYVSLADSERDYEWEPVLITFGNAGTLNIHVGKYHYKAYNDKTDAPMLSATSLEVPSGITRGEIFNASVTVRADYADYTGDINITARYENGKSCTLGTLRDVCIPKGQSASLDIECSSENLTCGKPTVCVSASSNLVFHEGAPIDVESGSPVLAFHSAEYPREIFSGQPFSIGIRVISRNAPFSGKLECIAISADGIETAMSESPIEASIAADGLSRLDFDMLPFEDRGEYTLRLIDTDSDISLDIPEPLIVLHRDFILENVTIPDNILRGEYNHISLDFSVSGDAGFDGIINFFIESDNGEFRYCDWKNYNRVNMSVGENPQNITFRANIPENDFTTGPAALSFFISDNPSATEGQTIGSPYPVFISDEESSVVNIGTENRTIRFRYNRASRTAAIDGAERGDHIAVHDITGRCLITTTAPVANPVVNLSEIPNGIYILHAKGKTMKIILK